MTPTDAKRPRALVDAHFWFALGDHVDTLDDVLATTTGRWARALAARSPLVRSCLTARVARHFELVVIDHSTPSRGLLGVLALTGRSRALIALNFHPLDPLLTWRRPVRRFRFVLYERPLFARVVRRVQPLCLADVDTYKAAYRVDRDRFAYIPHPWRRRAEIVASHDFPPGRRVLASGNAACDWETLFAAAHGRRWDLTVVCGQRDRARVDRLARATGATVLCAIPRADHDALLHACDVYVLAIREQRVSTGHVRLKNATECGVPVVVAAVAALREYVVPGQTALTYAPGNAAALGVAVDALLDDPGRASEIAGAAAARGSTWTQAHTFEAQRALVERELGLDVPTAHAPLAPVELEQAAP